MTFIMIYDMLYSLATCAIWRSIAVLHNAEILKVLFYILQNYRIRQIVIKLNVDKNKSIEPIAIYSF